MKKENKKEDCFKIEKILRAKGLLTKESIFSDIVENETVKQVGKIILAAVFISGAVAVSVVAPNIFAGLGALKKIFRSKQKEKMSKQERRRMMQTIYNLRRRKLIEYDEKGDKIILKITPAGRTMFISNYIYALKVKKQEKWDRIWRIVIFDIPVSRGCQRDIFRDRLKKMGFYQFQKSAFIVPYPCRKELEAILDYYDLFDYVTFIEAEHISGEDRCRGYFEL